ncbi:hypothetical protein, partial [Pseudomonas aeruginosa]
HYSDLLISHKAIQKDEKQLELLAPVIQNKQKLDDLRIKKQKLDFVEEQMPFFLGKIEYELLEKDVDRLVLDIEIAQKDKEFISTSVDTLDK